MQELKTLTKELIALINQNRLSLEPLIKAYKISEDGYTWLSEESDILDGIVSHLNDLENYLGDV